MTPSFCAVVPSYNHHLAIEAVVKGLKAQGLTVIIIDDGSAEPARSALAKLDNPAENIFVFRLKVNQGKGAATLKGLEIAGEKGFTHAIQVDADGQHDLTTLPVMVKLAADNPKALISGQPVYDETIPRSRKIARWLTHIWVWVETLSFQITDSMCGYRVYPIQATLDVAREEKIGQRMDFDTEIMVRLFWRGVPTMMTPVSVTYPQDNTSNFDLVADNWRITKMHTRLVFGMILRLPGMLKNRPEVQTGSTHWAGLDERGMFWGLWFLATCYRFFGRRVCLAIMQPVLLYFFLTGKEQRAASRYYWMRIFRDQGQARQPDWLRLYAHFRSFGEMALDKFAAWVGDISPDRLILSDSGEIDRVVDAGQGILVIASHLGNIEICRALGKHRHPVQITVFAHTQNAVKFNRLLSRYNPNAAIDVVEVSDIGPATAIDLEERLGRGEWVVIAGDRVPVFMGKRESILNFMGDPAKFSQGAILLGSVLKCPVYTMFCMKEGREFRVFFDLLANRIDLPRKDRAAKIDDYLKKYIGKLEEICRQYPNQWYNFFDFWQDRQ